MLRMLLLTAAALVTACSTPEYQPYHTSGILLFSNTWGYTDVPVRPDYYEVGFTNIRNANPTQARFYATLHAAELALAHHQPFFEIVEATPGESPHTWAAITNPTAGNTADLAALERVHNSVDLDAPTSQLLIHLLDHPTPATLNARDILLLGKQRGITFLADTEKRLALPPGT
jgi:hypothetical protein